MKDPVLKTFVVASLIAAFASGVSAKPVGPSDCVAGHADSTCSQPVNVAQNPKGDNPFTTALYDGELSTGPFNGGYIYWGYDFAASARGLSDISVMQAFQNNSGSQISIKFSMIVPDNPSCQRNCLPGIVFYSGKDFHKSWPKVINNGGVATATLTVNDHEPYAWVIGLWKPSKIFMTVNASPNGQATMASAGLPERPDVAVPIQPKISQCLCWDNSTAPCSIGTRYSNGLMSLYLKADDGPVALDAFNDCPPER